MLLGYNIPDCLIESLHLFKKIDVLIKYPIDYIHVYVW